MSDRDGDDIKRWCICIGDPQDDVDRGLHEDELGGKDLSRRQVP